MCSIFISTMKKLFILFLLIPFSNLSGQIKIDSLRYKHALKAPKTQDVNYLARYLRAGAKTERRTIETFFYWISQNIEYDLPLSERNDLTEEDVSVKATLEKRKTICDGYSRLFLALCQAVKIDCIKITGDSKSFLSNKEAGHAWNGVRINQKLYLVDATWGAGYINIDTNKYTKKLNLNYFCSNPDYFIIDHFPKDEYWQLLVKPISREQFLSTEWDNKREQKFNAEREFIEVTTSEQTTYSEEILIDKTDIPEQ